MKKIGLLALLLLFVSSAIARCKGQKLRCIKASAQAFVGGAAGSPSGTAYRFLFIAPANSENLHVDQVWIDADYYEVGAALDMRSGSSNAFSKGDTISITAQKLNQNPMNLNNLTDPVHTLKSEKPYASKGAALVGYTIGKKRKYLEVEKLEILKRANYQ